MTELSGLQLRKAASVAVGLKPRISWIASRDGGESLAIEYAMQWDCDQWCKEHPGYATVRYENWPAIESDPAISENIFLEWCEKNGYTWVLQTCACGHVPGKHFVLWLHDHKELDVEVDAATPSKARARAIVAASELGKKRED